MISVFLRQCTSIFQYLLSGNIPTLLHHESFRLTLIPQSLFFHCNPSLLAAFFLFLFSLLHVSVFFGAYLLNASISVPFFVAHYHSISCTTSEPLPACPFFSPYHVPHMRRFYHLPILFAKYFGPVHFPCIFMYLLLLPHLMHRYLLVAAYHSIRCFVPSHFLSTNIHFSFG